MYPGYRWLEPEVVIRVGVGEETREFRGPRKLLSEQSGYIKSLLESANGNEISVPSVSPSIFASILNFVNTGYLDLNSENIYSILLATHLLHMPRAVDICRSFLMNEQIPRIPTIVKPIPSRKFLPTLYWPPPPPIFPTHFCHIPTSNFEPIPSTSIVPEKTTEETTKPADSPRSKETIKDIACCDGPVRFKRVLNDNYGITSKTENQKEPCEGKLFVCGFCKHTFKSHYCYRKHTRRHINPVIPTPEKEGKDMNVQYYPCKTCGSKFPSYYFVHKHRKLCHLNENDIEEKPKE